jgi:hypothetical protein
MSDPNRLDRQIYFSQENLTWLLEKQSKQSGKERKRLSPIVNEYITEARIREALQKE